MNINYILIGLITLIIGFHIFNSSSKESITNLNVKDLSIKKENGKLDSTSTNNSNTASSCLVDQNTGGGSQNTGGGSQNTILSQGVPSVSLTQDEIESWGESVQSIDNLVDGTSSSAQRIASQTIDWKNTNGKNKKNGNNGISSINNENSKDKSSTNEKTNQAISNSISKVSGGTTGMGSNGNNGSNGIISSISDEIDGTATVNISFGAPGDKITSSIRGAGSSINEKKKEAESFSTIQRYTQPVIRTPFSLRPGAFK